MKAVRLGRLAVTVSGSGFPPSLQGLEKGDLPFLKVSDLARPQNADGVVGAANWVSEETASELGARVIPPGATVFPKVGAALRGNARGMALRPCLIDNNMMALVPRLLEPRFAFWLMRHIDMGPLSAGGTLPFVSDTTVRDLEVPWPAPHQQRRIADFLDDRVARIDRIIAARRNQAMAVRELFESARASAVLSPDWPVRRLSHLARMGTGHTPSRTNRDYWQDCTIPWLTTSDVHRFRKDEIDILQETSLHISYIGLENSAAVLHPAGTVALSRTASAGFSIVMGQDMATSQDFATWTCTEGLVPEFLLHTLRARRSYLLGYLSMGSTHKTIYFPDLMDLTIALPSAEVQRAAVAEVIRQGELRNRTLAALERQIDLLTEYKTSLITAAVTGELDVTTAGSGIPA